jgi:hypothetical protein
MFTPFTQRIAEAEAKYGRDACWPWPGKLAKNGRAYYGKPKRLAYRLAYVLVRGAIPDGLTLDHQCDNPRCWNPWHVEPETHWENNRRGNSAAAINARKTECKNGHPFTPENTYTLKRGERVCRTCDLARQQRRSLAL